MLRVEISAAAERDLEEIAEYIARDDIVAAEGWVAKLVALARAAATNPRAGRVVPEWSSTCSSGTPIRRRKRHRAS